MKSASDIWHRLIKTMGAGLRAPLVHEANAYLQIRLADISLGRKPNTRKNTPIYT